MPRTTMDAGRMLRGFYEFVGKLRVFIACVSGGNRLFFHVSKLDLGIGIELRAACSSWKIE